MAICNYYTYLFKAVKYKIKRIARFHNNEDELIISKRIELYITQRLGSGKS